MPYVIRLLVHTNVRISCVCVLVIVLVSYNVFIIAWLYIIFSFVTFVCDNIIRSGR
jgi:hypothetical protein